MIKSIVQSDRTKCFICGSRRDLEEHHCWHGTANRAKSTVDGLVVSLCVKCHRDLHDHGYEDRWVMAQAQTAWCRHYGKSLGDFRMRYGKIVC